MIASTLYHFSDHGDIEQFIPRPPLRHPEAEPLVYAIDPWHSPLYFFPRDCPRIALWPTASSTAEDAANFQRETSARMLLFIENTFEPDWRGGSLFRYEFHSSDDFIDTGDIGVWVSRQIVKPKALVHLTDLPAEALNAGVEVRTVSSLIDTATSLHDFANNRFLTTLHVSMIRTSLLPNWPKPVVKEAYRPTKG